MENNAVMLKKLKRDLLVVSIMLTILTFFKIVNPASILLTVSSFYSGESTVLAVIKLLLKVIPIALLVSICVGAWKMARGKFTGCNIVCRACNVYKVLCWLGIIFFALIAFTLMFLLIVNKFSFESLLKVLIPEIIVSGVLFIIFYINQLATNFLSDMQERLLMPDDSIKRVTKSPLYMILFILGICNLVALLVGPQNLYSIITKPFSMEKASYAMSYTGMTWINGVYEYLMDSVWLYPVTAIFTSVTMLTGSLLIKNYSKNTQKSDA